MKENYWVVRKTLLGVGVRVRVRVRGRGRVRVRARASIAPSMARTVAWGGGALPAERRCETKGSSSTMVGDWPAIWAMKPR